MKSQYSKICLQINTDIPNVYKEVSSSMLLSVDYGFLYICEIFDDIKMHGTHINMQKYIKHSK